MHIHTDISTQCTKSNLSVELFLFTRQLLWLVLQLPRVQPESYVVQPTARVPLAQLVRCSPAHTTQEVTYAQNTGTLQRQTYNVWKWCARASNKVHATGSSIQPRTTLVRPSASKYTTCTQTWWRLGGTAGCAGDEAAAAAEEEGPAALEPAGEAPLEPARAAALDEAAPAAGLGESAAASAGAAAA